MPVLPCGTMDKLCCVILAAGIGKRMGGNLPKAITKTREKALIDHVLDSLSLLKPTKTVIVVGHGREALESHVRASASAAGHAIEFAVQEKPLGTGDAARAARAALEGFEGAMVDGLRVKGAANLDLLPQGRGILLVEFGFDDAASAQAQAETLVAALKSTPHPPAMRSPPWVARARRRSRGVPRWRSSYRVHSCTQYKPSDTRTSALWPRHDTSAVQRYHARPHLILSRQTLKGHA